MSHIPYKNWQPTQEMQLEHFRLAPPYPPTHLRNAVGDRLYRFVMRKKRRWLTVERFHPSYESAREYAAREAQGGYDADLVLVYEVAPIGP